VAADLADRFPYPGCEPYRICRVDGVWVALVGLSAKAADHPGRALEALADTLRQVRAKGAHLTVLLAHLAPGAGADEDGQGLLEQAVARHPEIDVVLGGGSGSVTRAADMGPALFTQAGREARWLGRVDLVYDTVAGACVSRASTVLDVGPDVPVHAGLRQGLGPSLGRVEQVLDRVVGTCGRRLAASSPMPGQSGTQELVARTLAGAAGADVVLIGNAGLGGLAKGPVQYRDILRAIPDLRQVACMAVTPGELRAVLEENMALRDREAFLGIHGARYEWVTAEGSSGRVEALTLADASRPHGRRRLRVAFDASLLSPELANRDRLRRTAAAPTSRLEILEVDLRAEVSMIIAEGGAEAVRPGPGFSER
jgi:2',3'-cyclic-nucleotide 2'-phosphodiesterase (5'-nucleotidase family)